MRSARDKWSFSKLDEILESVAASRVQQADTPLGIGISDIGPISQHTVGVDVPDPFVGPPASVEPVDDAVDPPDGGRLEGDQANADQPDGDQPEGDQQEVASTQVSIDLVEARRDEAEIPGAAEAPAEIDLSGPSLPTNKRDVWTQEATAGKCKDNADDTFDLVARRLSKVRHSDVRRRRLKLAAVGLVVTTLLAGGTVMGVALAQRPEAPFAWVTEQSQQLLGLLLGSEQPGEPWSD